MNSKQLIKIWTRVLIEAFEGKSAAEQKKVFGRLKAILKSKKKEYLLRKIAENTIAAMKKETEFEIIMAHEQPLDTVNKLEEKLARILCAEDAQVRTDPALIGGFVAKTDQCLIDASVKGFLQQLKKIYQ